MKSCTIKVKFKQKLRPSVVNYLKKSSVKSDLDLILTAMMPNLFPLEGIFPTKTIILGTVWRSASFFASVKIQPQNSIWHFFSFCVSETLSRNSLNQERKQNPLQFNLNGSVRYFKNLFGLAKKPVCRGLIALKRLDFAKKKFPDCVRFIFSNGLKSRRLVFFAKFDIIKGCFSKLVAKLNSLTLNSFNRGKLTAKCKK